MINAFSNGFYFSFLVNSKDQRILPFFVTLARIHSMIIVWWWYWSDLSHSNFGVDWTNCVNWLNLLFCMLQDSVVVAQNQALAFLYSIHLLQHLTFANSWLSFSLPNRWQNCPSSHCYTLAICSVIVGSDLTSRQDRIHQLIHQLEPPQ